MPKLPKLGEIGIPRGTRSLRAVENLAVGRQLDDFDLRQTVPLGPTAYRFYRVSKTARASHTVKPRQVPDGLLGDGTRKLPRDGRNRPLGQQRGCVLCPRRNGNGRRANEAAEG